MTRNVASDDRAVADALLLLGADHTTAYREIRRRYLELIRDVHPDLADEDPDATRRSAALNMAWGVIARATDHGRLGLPSPPEATAGDPPLQGALDGPVVTLHAPAGDVYVQLLDAAHEVGEVSYIDPEAGLIQVLLEGEPAASQLLITVDSSTVPVSATFVLDSMNRDGAPSIHDVVARLAGALHRASEQDRARHATTTTTTSPTTSRHRNGRVPYG